MFGRIISGLIVTAVSFSAVAGSQGVMTETEFDHNCSQDFIVRRAAEKVLLRMYQESLWGVVPAGTSQTDVDTLWTAKSVSDLEYVGIDPAPVDLPPEIFQFSYFVKYRNKAGKTIGIRVRRSLPRLRLHVSEDLAELVVANSESRTKRALELELYAVVSIDEDVLKGRKMYEFCNLKADNYEWIVN